jgi:protein NrfD
VKFHLWSVGAKALAVGAVATAAALAWDTRLAPSFGAYLLSIDGVFFWQRVFFGLVGPAVLSYMTWETAKIRSTQSATGILYVDFFTVIIGELGAKYLLQATALPF